MPTWRQISTAQTNAGADNPTGQPGTYCAVCNYAHVLSVDPSDPGTVFAGGKAFLWRCTNCASAPQWKNLTYSPNASNPPDLFADQQTIAWAGGRLILGNDGGVFSTPDRGTTWQNHNASLPTVMFYIGALHPSDPNFMIGGSRDHGMTIRRDGSSSWSVAPMPQNSSQWGGEGDVALSVKHPETDWMLAGAAGGAIYRTTDGGRTTTRADGGIKDSGGFLNPVRKCPSNDDVFLAGRAGLVWRTDNFFNSDAPSWSLNGPSGATGTTAQIYAISFVLSDTSCNTYAYGTSGGEIRLTRDGGKTWMNPDPPTGRKLPVRAINSIAFDPTTSDTIYVALSSFNPAPPGRTGHIYKTTNASSAAPAWTNVGPSDDVPFNIVVVDPRNPSLVYAGSDTGLWVSGDAGATWHKIGPDRGLPPAAIYDIQINPATNQTVVFTHGRGAFRLAQ